MKYIGIDYGTKRIGIAISDEEGLLAFPRVIIPNNKDLVLNITEIIKDEGAEAVVIGESLAQDGKENILMKKVREFALDVEKKTNLPIFFEKEFFSSVEARRNHEVGEVDDSAAALILQRHLDKKIK